MEEQPHRIGIDLGGTKIEAVILDPDGKILERERTPTHAEQPYERIVQRLGDFILGRVSKVKDKPFTLGMGTPGAISKKTGLLKNSNTTTLNGMPFKEDLEKHIGRSIAIENDANCFAMAEAEAGAGQGYEVVFGVIMGTGCGGGIVFNGKVHTGLMAIGGEWGHHTINYKNGPECFTGKKGCAEGYISGSGLQALFEKQFGMKKDFKDIVHDWRSGEARYNEFMEAFFQHFGIAMSNLINILDPDVIVLGGGLSNVDELYTRGVEQVAQYVFSDGLETPIVKNQLGDSAGVFGAAYIGI